MVVSLQFPFVDMIVRLDAYLLRVLAQLSIPALSYSSCRCRAEWARWVTWQAAEWGEYEMTKATNACSHTAEWSKFTKGVRLMFDTGTRHHFPELYQVARALRTHISAFFSAPSLSPSCP